MPCWGLARQVYKSRVASLPAAFEHAMFVKLLQGSLRSRRVPGCATLSSPKILRGHTPHGNRATDSFAAAYPQRSTTQHRTRVAGQLAECSPRAPHHDIEGRVQASPGSMSINAASYVGCRPDCNVRPQALQSSIRTGLQASPDSRSREAVRIASHLGCRLTYSVQPRGPHHSIESEVQADPGSMPRKATTQH